MKISLTILMAAFAAFPVLSLAQSQPDQEQEAPALESAPKLIKLAPADIPKGTEFPADEVAVLLEIQVDEQGRVIEVKLLKGAGEPFDKAAVSAAEKFIFSPGRLNTGEAVPVTVNFLMRITAPKPAPEELKQAQAQPDKIQKKPEETINPEESGGVFETIVRAQALKREVVRQVIPKALVDKLPGTSGDVLKAVQNLPGAGRSSYGAGALILRGASPGDSRVFLEGQEMPLLYHFGGLRSTINSAFLEAVEYVPGNFAPDFGRATGGIVEVKVRDPENDMFRGNVDINLYDAGFALEGPLSEDWSIGGAFHRSWVDTFIGALIPEDSNLSFNTAPRYYDYQLLVSYRPQQDQKLRLMFYGSMDKVVLLFDRPSDDPTVRGEISARIMFHNLQASYSSRIVPRLSQETSLLLGLQQFKTEIGPEFFFNLDILRLAFRSAWTFEANEWISVRAGMDIRLDNADISLISPLRPIEGENPPPSSTQNRYGIESNSLIYEPAVFAEVELRPFKDLVVLPGLRVDYYRNIGRWTVDPRLTVRYRLGQTTTLKAGVGYFQQPPTPDQTVPELGNPNLYAQRSSHTTLGFEQLIIEGIDIQFAGFYKWLDRLVIRNPAFFSDPTTVPYLSGGTGRIWGLELLVRVRLSDWFSGWLAYTYQRSYRKDGPGAYERLFDFDQPHILTVLGTFELGAGWSAGFRFRLVSGNPITPVIGSIYDTVSGSWVPIYGKTNSDRLGAFHQLDLRVDKQWAFSGWKLSLYLDVQNVYMHISPEQYNYSYDYREREPGGGFPILPIIGVKGEW